MSSRLYSLLHCTVCTEKYNESDRRPKVLCCGHTFCMECLQELFSRSLHLHEHIPLLRCPSCRQTTEMFDVWCVFSLSDNFAIINFITDEKSSKQNCKKHQDEIMKVFCYQCQRWVTHWWYVRWLDICGAHLEMVLKSGTMLPNWISERSTQYLINWIYEICVSPNIIHIHARRSH